MITYLSKKKIFLLFTKYIYLWSDLISKNENVYFSFFSITIVELKSYTTQYKPYCSHSHASTSTGV